MKKFLVQVTLEDIQSEHRANPFSCPVARAVRRSLGIPTSGQAVLDTPYEVYVGSDTLGVNHHVGSQRKAAFWPLPPLVANFIKRFDDSRPVSPIEFILEWPGCC